ncbi:thiamine biosynthesis protein ThiS [uncultured Methanoregula sp.]|uniref:thiamine biosynthesis protein ThiS n=1 Tax=uncultured Methanoregula sp. TaxID=1005933 RepID=UPI002AAB310B|nr:thiamine biosynthesis protein ThiS [uncultured Methanoregula sp.]
MKLLLPDRSARVLALPPSTLEAILLGEGINPLEVIASRNGILITEDTVIGPDDEIRLLRIAHGG